MGFAVQGLVPFNDFHARSGLHYYDVAYLGEQRFVCRGEVEDLNGLVCGGIFRNVNQGTFPGQSTI